MAEEKPVHEQVQDLLQGWNKPQTDSTMETLVGSTPEPGDTRATVAFRDEAALDHDRNFARDDIDAQRQYQDDGDDDDAEEGSDYGDLSIAELRGLVDARNEGRDDDDKISKGGSADDIRERLLEDDEAADEEDDDDEDEDSDDA